MAKRSGTKASGKASLQKDEGGHQVPGFLKGESAPTLQAREYTKGSHDRTGASTKGTKITLPG